MSREQHFLLSVSQKNGSQTINSHSSVPEAFNNSECSFIFVLLEEIVNCV